MFFVNITYEKKDPGDPKTNKIMQIHKYAKKHKSN